MSDPFESSKVRLTWADSHIINLKNACLTEFIAKKPYTQIIETDSDGIHKVYKIVFARTLPDTLIQPTVEAIQDLRSSLDYAAYATACLSGISDPKKAYFPFCEKITDMDGVLKRRCRDIPSDIQTLFRTFQPYPSGNKLLWTLNRVCNAQKHGFIIATVEQSTEVQITRLVLHGTGTVPSLSPRIDRSKNEVVIARVTIDSPHFEYDVNITISVVFSKIKEVAGKNVIFTLRLMRDEVSRVVRLIEAACGCTGLLT